MATPDIYLNVARAEAYTTLRDVRNASLNVQNNIAAVQDLLEQIAAVKAQAEALKAQLDAVISAAGVRHRWDGTTIEIMDDAGVWQTGPDLRGPLAPGIEHRWVGTVLEIKDDLGIWQTGPDLRGEMGTWTGSVAFTHPRQVITNPGSTLTLNLGYYNEFDVFLDANITTITLTNLPIAGQAVRYAVYFWQDSTGGRTLDGWSNIVWAGGITPTINAVADMGTLIVFDTPGVGVSRGFVVDANLGPLP